MTPQEKAEKYFWEWPNRNDVYGCYDHAVAFAAYCLEQREKETGLVDANGEVIHYGQTIESIDSDGKPVRHLIEKDPKNGRPVGRYSTHSTLLTCDIYQDWIDMYKKVIVNNAP